MIQIFLPYPSLERSATTLSDEHLKQQRSDILAVLKTLNVPKTKPDSQTIRIWRGYEACLILYGIICCIEWKQRGHTDRLEMKFKTFDIPDATIVLPPWIGDAFLHRSHQSNLLRLDKKHYGQYFVRVPENLPFVWPA